MAKTYTIYSSSINPGSTASPGLHWDSYYATTGAGLMIGYYSSFYRAVNIMFNQSDLAQFSGKTITNITLKITASYGQTPSTNYPYRVRYKFNSTASGTASSHAWQTGNNGSYDDTDLAFIGNASGRVNVYDGQVISMSVGTTLPTNGYVIATNANGAAYMVIYSTATLEVTTNETEYTWSLSYNNNGGYGIPATQTITTTVYPVSLTVNPNYTAVTKTGHTLLGWSVNSWDTSPQYWNGSTIMISANTVLYAIWQADTYTVYYNKGSYGSGTNTSDTKTYNVNLTLRGALFTRSGYAQDGWATSDGGSAVYALGGTYTANNGITLYPSWKATTSHISANNGTLGTQMTIGIVRYNNSYTHTVTYKYGTQTGTVGTGIGTSVNWTPLLAWASEFPSSTSGTCELTCITYDGSTELGRTSTTITLSIPSSVKCTVTGVTLAETVSSVASKFSAYVQSKSKISVTGTTSTSGAYGAWVSAYSIAINGQTLTSNGAVTGLIASNGTLSYSFTITDSRGRTDTYTGTYNVLAYTAPSISATVQRNSSAPASIDINYSWSVSSVNNLNDKTLVIKFRPFGGGSWTTATTITPTTYSGNSTYTITGTDVDTAYETSVQLSDYFTTVSATSSVSAIGTRIFGISHVDQTIARHGDSPADGWDHEYYKEHFHDDVQIDGDASVGGTFGTTGNSTFGGSLIVTNRRITSSPSTQGWYRVLEFAPTSSFASYDLTGAIGALVKFHITRRYYWQGAETHEIELALVNGAVRFINESSASSVIDIDKIRYITDSAKGYVDIHYVSSQENQVGVDIDVYAPLDPDGVDYNEQFTSKNLVSVLDAPSGETVQAIYTFATNTAIDKTAFSPTTGSSYSPYGDCWYARQGKVCHVHVGLSGLTASTAQTVYTLPTGIIPMTTVVSNGIGDSIYNSSRIAIYANGVIEVESASQYAMCDVVFICN